MNNNNEMCEKCQNRVPGGACAELCARSPWYGVLAGNCRSRTGVPFASPWENAVMVAAPACGWVRGRKTAAA